jgi:pantetheine-phosphate adenylyltransferase/dephospho-CoA kinase
MIVGVTGSSGAGKSSFARATGYRVIDADAVYHELLQRDAALRGALEAEFGTSKRAELSKIVFKDVGKLARLGAITHPRIVEEIVARLGGDVVIDAPLLHEAGLDKYCDIVVAVVAREEVRLGRVMKRDRVSRVRAAERLAAQQGDEYYTGRADYVVVNDGTEEELEVRARVWARRFRAGVAVYSGTFDPPTLGHLDVVRRSAQLYDKLYVVVAQNETKIPVWLVEERLEMLRQVCAELPNVVVEAHAGLLADYAYKKGAHYLVRGARNGFEIEEERPVFELNAQIAADRHDGYELDTVFVPTSLKYMDTRSSNIRAMLTYGAYETAQRYIDARIWELVKSKFGG